MVLTAQTLVREVGARWGDFVLSAPTGGSTTTLVDALLDEQLSADVSVTTGGDALGWWVYGATDALVAGNVGVQRRAKSYVQSTHTLGFFAAWPASISGGHYEIYTRQPRSRHLEAVNAALRLLDAYWWRPVLDEASLTTTANVWQYTLPNTVLWNSIPRLEVQIATTVGSYPYMSADRWNWRVDQYTDASGVTTWRLQFGTLPPPGRKLRIFGEASYADLVADTDILPLALSDLSHAQEWLYTYALYQLTAWDALRNPAGASERLERQGAQLLQQATALRGELQRGRASLPLVLLGRGEGTWEGALDDPGYLAAFGSPH